MRRIISNVTLILTVFAEHRRMCWPDPDLGAVNAPLADIYCVVKATGVPNALSARCTLPTNLNLYAWKSRLTGIDDQLFDLIRYGFPIGPVSNPVHVPNHPIATAFPRQVNEFMKKELALGGMLGPFVHPQFVQWTHVSPLMTRP